MISVVVKGLVLKLLLAVGFLMMRQESVGVEVNVAGVVVVVGAVAGVVAAMEL